MSHNSIQIDGVVGQLFQYVAQKYGDKDLIEHNDIINFLRKNMIVEYPGFNYSDMADEFIDILDYSLDLEISWDEFKLIPHTLVPMAFRNNMIMASEKKLAALQLEANKLEYIKLQKRCISNVETMIKEMASMPCTEWPEMNIKSSHDVLNMRQIQTFCNTTYKRLEVDNLFISYLKLNMGEKKGGIMWGVFGGLVKKLMVPYMAGILYTAFNSNHDKELTVDEVMAFIQEFNAHLEKD